MKVMRFNIEKYKKGRNASCYYWDWNPLMLEMFEKAGDLPTSVDKRYEFTTCVDYFNQKTRRKKYLHIAIGKDGRVSILANEWDSKLNSDDLTVLVPKILNALKLYMDYGFLIWEAKDESRSGDK